jgi:hypothetical protein
MQVWVHLHFEYNQKIHGLCYSNAAWHPPKQWNVRYKKRKQRYVIWQEKLRHHLSLPSSSSRHNSALWVPYVNDQSNILDNEKVALSWPNFTMEFAQTTRSSKKFTTTVSGVFPHKKWKDSFYLNILCCDVRNPINLWGEDTGLLAPRCFVEHETEPYHTDQSRSIWNSCTRATRMEPYAHSRTHRPRLYTFSLEQNPSHKSCTWEPRKSTNKTSFNSQPHVPMDTIAAANIIGGDQGKGV